MGSMPNKIVTLLERTGERKFTEECTEATILLVLRCAPPSENNVLEISDYTYLNKVGTSYIHHDPIDISTATH
jgi:hypothetical protein